MASANKFFLLLAFAFCFIEDSGAEDSGAASTEHCGVPVEERIDHQLTSKMLKDYNVKQIPDNHSLGFFHMPVILQRFNSKTNLFSLGVQLSLSWYDARLNISMDFPVMVDKGEIWMPKVSTLNEFEGSSTDFKYFELESPVIYKPGHVYTIVFDTFSSYCEADLRDYPFDSQMCITSFEIEDVSAEELLINKFMEKFAQVSLDNEWTISKYTISTKKGRKRKACSQESSILELIVTVKRNYQMHIYLYLIPSLVILFLTLSLYLVPHSSKQRFNLAVGISFGLIILSSFCSSMFPNGLGTSTRLVSGLLYGYLLFFVTFVASLVTCNLSSRNPSVHPIPSFLSKFLNNRVVNLITGVSNNNDDDNNDNNDQPTTISTTTSQQQSPKGKFEGVLQVLYQQQQQQQLEKKDNEWKRISRMLDRLFFYLSSFITLISCLVFYA